MFTNSFQSLLTISSLITAVSSVVDDKNTLKPGDILPIQQTIPDTWPHKNYKPFLTFWWSCGPFAVRTTQLRTDLRPSIQMDITQQDYQALVAQSVTVIKTILPEICNFMRESGICQMMPIDSL